MIWQAFSLALLLASGLAQAQPYRWIDKDGRVQFTDSPPPASAKGVQKTAPAGNISGGTPQVPFELATAQKNFPIVLYTSPNCKEGCDAVRGALNKRGAPFKEVQVYDQATTDELKRVSGGTGVPTMLVGRSVQRGFEQEAFDALLDNAGYPRAGVAPPRSQKAPPAPEGYVSPAGEKAAIQQETPTKGGRYDPSGLTGPPPKQGQYSTPGESK